MAEMSGRCCSEQPRCFSNQRVRAQTWKHFICKNLSTPVQWTSMWERILSVTFPGVHFPTFPEKLSKIISKCVEGWKHKWRGHTKNELEALWQALESWGLKNFLFSPEWAFLGNYAIKLLEVLNVHFKLLIFHLIWWCTKCSHNIVATTQTCKRVQQLCKVHMWPSWKKKVWNFSNSVK